MIVRRLAAGGGANISLLLGVSGAATTRLRPYTGSNSFLALPAPAAQPTDGVVSLDFSPNGQYVAFANRGNGTPIFSVYKVTGATMTRLADAATMPSVGTYALAWAPGSDYFAVAQENSDSRAAAVYSVSGITVTKVTGPTGTGTGSAVDWSPGGRLAVARDSNILLAYSVSGTTYSAMSFDTHPSDQSSALGWSPDDNYLAAGVVSSPYMAWYSRSGTALTKLTNPSTLPAGIVYGCKWSPSSDYLALTHDSSPFISVYSRSGSTLTKISNPGTLPTAVPEAAAWSPSGNALAVGVGAGQAMIYDFAGGALTYRSTISTGETGGFIQALAWK